MVRAPCCEKMGLKKGPWTRDEDQILINHVSLYGHSNWRALPKQAGLLRCGKSCRLRWTNYLRPDIKRGNFSEQEEETIINLHGVLGNRWSAIAARLPGRTDNEIKNVWHTHLKKRVKKIQETPESNQNSIKISIPEHDTAEVENPTEINYEAQPKSEDQDDYPDPNSPQQESSSITQTKSENQEYYPPNSPPQVSSVSTTTTTATTTSEEGSSTCMNAETLHDFLQDEGFWSDVFSAETSDATSDFPVGNPFQNTEFGYESNSNNMNEGMDTFWYDIFTRSAGELPELPEF